MIEYYVLIYTGADGTFKVRAITETKTYEETSASDVSFFKEKQFFSQNISSFFVFLPYGGTPDKLDFHDGEQLWVITTTVPFAHEFLEKLDKLGTMEVFNNLHAAVVDRELMRSYESKKH
jgi:hypothetical protein